MMCHLQYQILDTGKPSQVISERRDKYDIGTSFKSQVLANHKKKNESHLRAVGMDNRTSFMLSADVTRVQMQRLMRRTTD